MFMPYLAFNGSDTDPPALTVTKRGPNETQLDHTNWSFKPIPSCVTAATLRSLPQNSRSCDRRPVGVTE